MDDKSLEQFYEKNVLPRYSEVIDVDLSKIIWKDHGKVDLDTWAHYFEDQNGREYVLLWEDFPGSTFLDDNLTHEAVMIDDEMSIHYINGEVSAAPNISGYFTLFREKMPRL